MPRPNNFTRSTQAQAQLRQKNRCASCGTEVTKLGKAGQRDHFYGEAAHAHHVIHVKLGGTAFVDNCVILCESCHYCVHEGGNYRTGTVIGTVSDFPHFFG